MVSAVAVAVAACAAQAFTLVENGKAKPVVLPANAEESSKLAACEFTNYVARATGNVLEVKVRGEGEQRKESSVVIGTLATLPDAPKEVREKLAAAKSSEASVTVEKDGIFWIVGKEEVAELYGTYRLLEDQLGVRWFKAWEPDDPGDFVPEVKGMLELDGKLTLRAPYFSHRRLTMTGSSTAHIPYKGYEWVFRAGLQTAPPARNYLDFAKFLLGERPTDPKKRERWDYYKPRIQVRGMHLGGGHSMLFVPIPASKYYDEHPEYFAEVDGKRVKGERYCLSNTNVQHLVAQNIIDTLRVTGDRGEYLFGLQDGRSGICECANCRALDDEGAKNRQLNTDITTRFTKVISNIAAEVYREFPETDSLCGWAYSIYGRTPPKDFKHDPRMGGQFCITQRCYGHRLDDPNCPHNVERYAWLRGWMNVYDHGYMYEYGNCSHNYYAPYELNCASDLKLYKKMGLTGWSEEMTFVDSKPGSRFSKDPEMIRRRSEKSPSNWQWLYLVSRLTWDPDLDPQAVLDEIESKYYGEAYPAMKKYHALRRKLWDENTVCMGYPRGNPRAPTLLNVPGAKEELLGYLDEADKLATEPITKVRLAKDRRWLTIFWIEPNEEMRAKAGRALRAPKTAIVPKIDGEIGDAAWGGACWTSDFLELYTNEHKAPAADLATRAAMLSDADNLYFLFDCKDPAPDKLVAKHGDGEAVYGDDSIELMLFPPSEANTYFQICVNTKGCVTCYEQPRSKKRPDLGVVAAAKVGGDGYAIELKVPVAKMYPLERGDLWQVLFCRNRRVDDGRTPGRSNCWTLDGGSQHTTSDYRPMEIGEPYLKNGSFEQLDKKGLPVGWSCRGGTNAFFVVQEGSGHHVRLVGTAGLHYGLGSGELKQSAKPRKVSYSFKAKGTGKISVSFFRRHDTPDRKAPHGYRREQLPAEVAGRYDLTDEWKTYSGEYVIKPDEWCSISFQGEYKKECRLDDVSLRLIK